MPNRPIEGIVPALVTPFRQDERIDYSSWQTIIDTLVDAGVHGLLVGGSQGEFYALDGEERTVALRFSRQAVAGRVTVYGNVGAISTRETIKLALQAQAEGVDVLVVVTPYYIQPTQDELAEHYIEICRAVRAPVLGYNFPPHGGVELLPETVAQIAARCENFAGLKDSSGSLERALAYRNCWRERPMAVMVGFDNLLTAALDAGCAGIVTASANVAPRLYVDLYRELCDGRRDAAARLQALASDFGDLVSIHTFPSVTKEAMRMAGLPAGPCRKPVSAVPEPARARLAQMVAALRAANYLPSLARRATG